MNEWLLDFGKKNLDSKRFSFTCKFLIGLQVIITLCNLGFLGASASMTAKSDALYEATTLFVHPLSYSSATMGTAKKAVEYFLRSDPNFDCLVMAHTHKLGSYYQGDILMLEQGCCCDLSRLDYADGRLQMPATNGFVYLEQTPGGQLVQNSWRLIRI